uniref:Uncharacterized protein n=1 Tax=Romanomermis culicivorax TaxID=13658 RepID=A0A915HWX7_ROMCU
MERPPPMKVDDDITTNKLVIEESVVETPHSEMVDMRHSCPQVKPAVHMRDAAICRLDAAACKRDTAVRE